jgi:hypothetical protein
MKPVCKRSVAALGPGDFVQRSAAERIHRLHNDLGISYFTVNATPGTSRDTLEKLVAAVR